MNVRSFGKTKDGRTAALYVLMNSSGMLAAVTDYGAALVNLIVPDAKGRPIDVVLGYDDVTGYEKGGVHFGATVGRFANRIGNAEFVIAGKTYELEKNDGENSLHGGRDFYNKRYWEAKIPFAEVSSGEIGAAFAKESMNDGTRAFVLEDKDGDSVTFMLDSPDGDQGYPGALHIEVTYTLTEKNELHIDYRAELTDDSAGTPLNLTNHSYFNLTGEGSRTVLDHMVTINADRFTPSDSELIPTGELRDVAGTPMDFRQTEKIGAGIDSGYEPLVTAGGYDHNYVLNGWDSSAPYREVAEMSSEATGIRMTVLTDLPGMQFYTSNFLDDENGKDEKAYPKRSAACFETQFWPDAVNKENFPGGVLNAGEVFTSRTTYKFES